MSMPSRESHWKIVSFCKHRKH